MVHNCLMLDAALKSVVRSPFMSKEHMTQNIVDVQNKTGWVGRDE